MDRYIDEKHAEKSQLIIGSADTLNCCMQNEDKSIKICFSNSKTKNALILRSIIFRICAASTS